MESCGDSSLTFVSDQKQGTVHIVLLQISDLNPENGKFSIESFAPRNHPCYIVRKFEFSRAVMHRAWCNARTVMIFIKSIQNIMKY